MSQNDYVKIAVQTFFLEQKQPFKDLNVQAVSGFRILQMPEFKVEFYLYLFNLVGETWGWTGSLLLSETELQAKLERNKVFVAYLNAAPVGFFELEPKNSDELEILYFGLIPETTGRGLGRILMQSVFDFAEEQNTSTLSLHTCIYDSPSARAFYNKSGFKFVKESLEETFYTEKFLEKI